MRRVKFLLAAAVFALLFSASASATVVAFQLIQHDPCQSEVRASSYLIENSLFDFFFDRGIIVTNSPTAVSTDESVDEQLYYSALSEASSGFCNYFISLTIDYDTENSRNPEALIISNIEKISWNIFDLKTGKSVASGSRKTNKVSPERDNEKGISEFTSKVAQDIYNHFMSLS